MIYAIFNSGLSGLGEFNLEVENMQKKAGKRDKRIEREQGDVNTTENRRKYWERNLSEHAKKWFDEDAKYFLHQSLSTPVLNVLTRARGIYIEDINGKKYIDIIAEAIGEVEQGKKY